MLRDLKTLSKEVYSPDSKRQPHSKSRLRDFYDKYTVLFVAYRAVFGLLPSASHIVESAHGIVRQMYDPQVSAGNLNAKMRYKMGINHELSEERRRHVREICALRSSNADEGQPKKKQKASPNDQKFTQQMEGQQLIDLRERYTDEVFSMVPTVVKSQMSISAINKRGSKGVETNLRRQKKEHAGSLREKRVESRDDKDLEAF